MRRTVAVLACLLAILGLLAPAAFAQAPAPKVTINGLFDQATSYNNNIADGNLARKGDSEWYARTRFRPDFTFEVGRTKAVLGLEFDMQWGQSGNCGAGPTKADGSCRGERFGISSGSSLNTDVMGIVEVKWAYTQFDLTGKDSLLPFIPVQTVAMLGLQPSYAYGGLTGTYRITHFVGDFPGVSAETTWAPNLKTAIAYVQIEESLATFSRTGQVSGFPADQKPTRGDDFAIVITPTLTPFKGLDVRPVYTYLFAQGTTSGTARRSVTNITTPSGFLSGIAGNVANAPAYQLKVSGTPGVASYTNGDPSQHENRHTIGLDARWRSGPFSFDPTILYQFGKRSNVVMDLAGAPYTAHSVEADISAWLVDLEGGFQLGPLLLESRAIYSTGNKARDNIGRSQRYFEPLNNDFGYYSGWSSILSLSPADYLTGGSLGFMADKIGYDRYGRASIGFRATYSLTPTLAVYGIITPAWTAEKVDTDTTLSTPGVDGLARVRVCSRAADIGGTCFVKGDSRYIGTDLNLGTTWRFAPNTVFDLTGGYLVAGHALDDRECDATGTTCTKERAHNGYTVSARLRMAF
jgi:hypothetical protein